MLPLSLTFMRFRTNVRSPKSRMAMLPRTLWPEETSLAKPRTRSFLLRRSRRRRDRHQHQHHLPIRRTSRNLRRWFNTARHLNSMLLCLIWLLAAEGTSTSRTPVITSHSSRRNTSNRFRHSSSIRRCMRNPSFPRTCPRFIPWRVRTRSWICFISRFLLRKRTGLTPFIRLRIRQGLWTNQRGTNSDIRNGNLYLYSFLSESTISVLLRCVIF
mmetsp:Transcript_27343/g.48391  ORF Transcript_27343/g.48391 Transcript_27343/m.48391 type:complete len:214 (-) Transcript_27343:164-805(-)